MLTKQPVARDSCEESSVFLYVCVSTSLERKGYEKSNNICDIIIFGQSK